MASGAGPLAGFTDRDGAAGRRILADLLEELAELPGVADAKRASFAAVADARAAGPVLEAGCGTGVDLASWPAACRPVVGVDHSTAMLHRAQHRSDAMLVCADVHRLPFGDAVFAAVRAERLLMHDRAPEVTLAQMGRVVRPGGPVVLVEPDVRAAVAGIGVPKDLRGSFEQWTAALFTRPAAGAELSALVAAAGLREQRRTVLTQACDWDGADAVLQIRAWSLAANTNQGLTGRRARHEWLDALVARDAQGQAVCTVPITVVLAVRPPSAGG